MAPAKSPIGKMNVVSVAIRMRACAHACLADAHEPDVQIVFVAAAAPALFSLPSVLLIFCFAVSSRSLYSLHTFPDLCFFSS